MELLEEFKILIQEGERLRPFGGDMFTGFNGEKQSEFLSWRLQAISAIESLGNDSKILLKEIDFPVIKSFRIDESFDYSTLSKYKDVSYLLDSYSVNEYGGTGKKFDWEKIPISLRHKIILSGGVSSENIEYIFTQIKPKAVDLSSSVEIVPGKKDKNKLNEFFNKINYLKHKL